MIIFIISYLFCNCEYYVPDAEVNCTNAMKTNTQHGNRSILLGRRGIKQD